MTEAFEGIEAHRLESMLPSMEEPESILTEAERIINGNRQSDYGHPVDNHARTATLWVTYLEGKYGISVPIDPEDVCFMNILQKIGREMHRKTRDGITDIAGYAGNIEMIRDAENKPTENVENAGPRARALYESAIQMDSWPPVEGAPSAILDGMRKIGERRP